MVTIQTEHEVQGVEDPPLPQSIQQPLILGHGILHLLNGGDAFRADVLDADIDVVAAGLLGQVQQLFIPGGVDGPEATPLQVQGRQRLEQILGVLPVAGEIVVNEIDVLQAGNAHVGLDLGDNLIQGPRRR